MWKYDEEGHGRLYDRTVADSSSCDFCTNCAGHVSTKTLVIAKSVKTAPRKQLKYLPFSEIEGIPYAIGFIMQEQIRNKWMKDKLKQQLRENP